MPKQKLKPIPVKAYKCPRRGCGYVIIGTKKQAQEHIDKPVDTPLPKGFVYRRNNFIWVNYLNNQGIAHDHGIKQSFNGYVIGVSGIRGHETISSREVKDKLAKKLACLLTEQDLKRFEKENLGLKEKLNIPSFIITTPELEALVAEAQPVGE